MTRREESAEMEEFFSENGAEALAAISEMVTTQQDIALKLTMLVLEHSVKNKISTSVAKKEIFAIYKEASDLAKRQLDL